MEALLLVGILCSLLAFLLSRNRRARRVSLLPARLPLFFPLAAVCPRAGADLANSDAELLAVLALSLPANLA